MPYAATNVATMIDKINRSYFLPAIQRPFVWNADQILALFDSLMKGYPISSFLFWDVAPENKPNWQIYKFAEHFKFGEVHNEIAETDGRDVTLVLDGQQRLTSLLIGLRGSFTVKGKNKRWDSPSAWTKTRLYIDLLVDPLNLTTTIDIDDNLNQTESTYGFSFFETVPSQANGHLWMKVGEILNCPSDSTFDQLKDSIVDKLPDNTSRSDERTVRRNLERLHRMIWKDEIICYFTEKDQDYDRVLGIFIRANDGGTKLSKSDLMLSMLASKWSDISAREEVYSLTEALNNRLDRKNDINKDLIMKASLLLSDLDHVYQIKNFTNQNLNIMRLNWSKIKLALRRSMLMVNRFGIDRDNLTSLNALLPIFYYIYKSDIDFTGGTTSFVVRNNDRIRRWLLSALLTNAFGGNSDSTIGTARRCIESSLELSKDFPIESLYLELGKLKKKPTNLTSATVKNIMGLRYGQRPIFLLLSLIYEEKNWGSIPHHIDHIFPKSRISRKSLLEIGISTTRIEHILESVDKVGNLQILTERDNLIKSNQKFEDWIRERDSSFIARNLIPTDEILWDIRMLPEFVEEREKLIAARLLCLEEGFASNESSDL